MYAAKPSLMLLIHACTYVYMYMYTYVYIYICIHTIHMYVYTTVSGPHDQAQPFSEFLPTKAVIFPLICICIYIHMYTCVFTYVNICISEFLPFPLICICIYIHMYTCVFT